MSTANSEARDPGEAESSARQSSQLDQLGLPLCLNRGRSGRSAWGRKNGHVCAGQFRPVESVRIGRLRRIPADALVTFLDELRRDIGAGAG